MVHNFIVIKNMLLIFNKILAKFLKISKIWFSSPENHKTGNTAKFWPDTQKRASDPESATQNYWKSVKNQIEGIFEKNFVDQCYRYNFRCGILNPFWYKRALIFEVLNNYSAISFIKLT